MWMSLPLCFAPVSVAPEDHGHARHIKILDGLMFECDLVGALVNLDNFAIRHVIVASMQVSNDDDQTLNNSGEITIKWIQNLLTFLGSHQYAQRRMKKSGRFFLR